MPDDATPSAHAASELGTGPAPRRFTRAEFDAMVASGLFPEGERVELIGGEIVSMIGEGPLHVDGTDVLFQTIEAILPPGLVALQRTRLDLPDETEVYPDILVETQGTRLKTRSAATVRLIVETADSSLKQDREEKAARCAAASFPEYSVFDVATRRVWVHRRPADGEWGEIISIEGDETIAPLFAPEARVSLPRLDSDGEA